MEHPMTRVEEQDDNARFGTEPDLTAPEAVERWDIHPYDQYSIEQRRCDTGDWVQYSDYAALSAERDDQKKARLEAVRSWMNAEARAEEAEAKFEQAKALYLETLGRAVEVEAELTTLKSELAEAVELVNLLYMRYDRALPSVEDLLARHQKETDQ